MAKAARIVLAHRSFGLRYGTNMHEPTKRRTGILIVLLWMDKFMMKPCKYRAKSPANWCRMFSINTTRICSQQKHVANVGSGKWDRYPGKHSEDRMLCEQRWQFDDIFLNGFEVGKAIWFDRQGTHPYKPHRVVSFGGRLGSSWTLGHFLLSTSKPGGSIVVGESCCRGLPSLKHHAPVKDPHGISPINTPRKTSVDQQVEFLSPGGVIGGSEELLDRKRVSFCFCLHIFGYGSK